MQIPLGNAGSAFATPQATPVARADTRVFDALGRAANSVKHDVQAIVDTDMAAAIRSRQIKMESAAKEIAAKNLLDPDEIDKAGKEYLDNSAPTEIKGLDPLQAERYAKANQIVDQQFQAGLGDLKLAAVAKRGQQSITTLNETAKQDINNGKDPAQAAAIFDDPTINAAGNLAWTDWDTRKRVMVSELYSQAVQQRMINDADGAATLYAQHKDKILEGDRASIDGKLQANIAYQRSQKAVDAVVAEYGPKGDRDPANLDVMDQQLKNDPTLKNNPESLKAARAGLKEWAATRDYAIRQRDNANADAVYGEAWQGATVDSVRKMPEFQSMDGKDQTQVIDYIRNRAWTLSQRNKEQLKDSPAAFELYWRYNQPDVLNSTNTARIIQLLPQLGEEKTNALLKRKAEMANPDKLSSEQLNTATFNKWVRVAGYDPADKKDKATLGALSYQLEKQVLAREVANGHKVSSDDYEKMVKQALIEVPVKGRFWGTNNTSLFKVDDRSTIVVPEKDFNQIADELEAAGVKATSDRVRQEYISRLGESSR